MNKSTLRVSLIRRFRDNLNNKAEKLNKEFPKQIINKDSNLDTNLFLLPEIIDYKCIICGYIPNPENAYEIICCGILMCKECLLKWIFQRAKCPICKNTLKNEEKYVRSIKDNNKIFYKTLKKLEIKCPYDCKWTGMWEELDNHLKECDKGYRECKYKELGCKFFGQKEKIKEHEENNDKLHLDLAMKFIKDNYTEEKKENNKL